MLYEIEKLKVYEGRGTGGIFMVGGNLLRIHSVDLKREKCELCGKRIYPSILSSVLGRWEYKYTCVDCVSKWAKVSKKRVREIRDNFVEGYKCLDYIDSSWVADTDKAKVLEEFLRIEEEDREFICNDELWKAHIFKENLDKGRVVFSEEEMFDYFNFYGNIPDIVFKLREVLFRRPKSNFLKDIYYKSRTRKLTRRQVDALRRDRDFRCISEDTKNFWDYLPLVVEYINEVGELDEESLKVKGVIECVLEYGFYTEKQRGIVEDFIEKRVLREKKGENLDGKTNVR